MISSLSTLTTDIFHHVRPRESLARLGIKRNVPRSGLSKTMIPED